ncbi:FAD/NAD(P)-binding protein [Arenibacter certesii]|uniref:FAD/NAD(P) binding domain-containing protein n=1 Tax=Arenibacter certesii TaxID=228955 RepID=A0A918J1X7_9FLAO|nr:FAD/NAD(P)-binding protein [Arenibacter certesii]GGW42477.1 FAD/NAD(P) binding domain-containing protein [Arenibacter certesii]
MENKIALIGSGPTAVYTLKNLLDNAQSFKGTLKSIAVFDKANVGGMGMPYNPEMTDIYNVSNISSEEIPLLQESFADWLRRQTKKLLSSLNVTEFPISESKVYSRLSLGRYFKSQYNEIIKKLKEHGFIIDEYYGIEIIDIVPDSDNTLHLLTSSSHIYKGFTKVIVATGHIWPEEDAPDQGYYASPWPIHKLLPKENTYYNFKIGILGASLSAFDVVTSLAHRHGTFHKNRNGLEFKLNSDAGEFKIVMHSAEGWLPHLQYEQERPIREIYRHTDRDELLSLINNSGFMPLDVYFDQICRPALIEAFKKDSNNNCVKLLSEGSTGFLEFIDHMEQTHDYVNSFEGMRNELMQAKAYLDQNRPTHWMETLDDLMYCLNFHAELISAEDHLFFNQKMMPFLMNVIAALPLQSANILLALYDAGCIELVKGKVEVLKESSKKGKTYINVIGENDKIEPMSYSMFINSSGQGKIKFKDYPFPSLIKNNIVSEAKAKYQAAPTTSQNKLSEDEENIVFIEDDVYLYTGGIAIDAGYRVINSKGKSESKIYDVSFIHTAGCRPYSYGLQACNATSLILVEHLKRDFDLVMPATKDSIEEITKIYEKKEAL